jgi:hypothetical protein
MSPSSNACLIAARSLGAVDMLIAALLPRFSCLIIGGREGGSIRGDGITGTNLAWAKGGMLHGGYQLTFLSCPTRHRAAPEALPVAPSRRADKEGRDSNGIFQ